MKNKLFKKMVTFGLVGTMVMGMATNVMAGSDTRTIYIGSDGYAYCHVDCDFSTGVATANTTVYANHNAYYISAYADVELGILKGSGTDYSDIDYEENGYNNKNTASASAFVTGDTTYSFGIYAYSTHEAEITGLTNSCSLMAEDMS